MKKEVIQKPEFKLMGFSVITNNIKEQDPQIAKIGQLIGKYFSENISAQIPHRNNPGTFISVYTHYQSDEHGDYTFYFGEEVSSFEGMPAGLQSVIIPASQYIQFTTPAGSMPTVVINAWQAIWKMTPQELGGKRRYAADLEIYDTRASDPTNTIADICISIA